MRTFFTLFFALLLIAGGLFFLHTTPSPQVQKKNEEQEVVKSSPAKPGSNGMQAPNRAAVTTAVVSTERTIPSTWLHTEGEAMNHVTGGQKEIQQHLREMAAKLTPADVSYLVAEATNSARGDNQRALALYLLTLDKNAPSEAFKEIALVNDPVFQSDLSAHSPNEWKARSITAIAVGALDTLFHRARTDKSYVRDVQEVSEKAPIPLVARTAKSMLKMFETRRPSAVRKK